MKEFLIGTVLFLLGSTVTFFIMDTYRPSILFFCIVLFPTLIVIFIKEAIGGCSHGWVGWVHRFLGLVTIVLLCYISYETSMKIYTFMQGGGLPKKIVDMTTWGLVCSSTIGGYLIATGWYNIRLWIRKRG